MPKEQEEFLNAVDRILEAVMFENWLRFYFLNEMTEDDAEADAPSRFFLIVPEQGMHKIAQGYPTLLPMAQALNKSEMTFDVSQRAICSFVVEHLDGKIMPRDFAPSVMDSRTFQIQLQLFNTWVQLHADQLEKDVLDFSVWRELFVEWKNTPAAQELAGKLALATQ